MKTTPRFIMPEAWFWLTFLIYFYREYTSSSRTISSARFWMLFLRRTHSIWSAAFNSSVTPSRSAIAEMMASIRSLQDWSISARCWNRVPSSVRPAYRALRCSFDSGGACAHICRSGNHWCPVKQGWGQGSHPQGGMCRPSAQR